MHMRRRIHAYEEEDTYLGVEVTELSTNKQHHLQKWMCHLVQSFCSAFLWGDARSLSIHTHTHSCMCV